MNKKLLLMFLMVFVIALLVLQFFILPSILTPTIMGTVAPAQSGVRVQAIHTNYFVAEAITDANGNYRISNLQPINYSLLFITNGKTFIYNSANVGYAEASIINVTDTLDLRTARVITFDINLSTKNADFVADIVRVRFKDNVSQDTINEIIKDQNCTVHQIINWSFLGNRPLYDLSIPMDQTVMQMVRRLTQIQQIERATSHNFVYGGGS